MDDSKRSGNDHLTRAVACEDESPPADDNLNFLRRRSDRAAPQLIALSGIIGFGAAWALAAVTPDVEPSYHLILFLSLTALPMVLLNIFANRTHHRETSGLRRTAGPLSLRRVGVKLLGLTATLAALAFAYWLFPEYHKERYDVLWSATTIVALPGGFLTIAYFIWADRRMVDPHDGYWTFGMMALGRWKHLDRNRLREHVLAWTIKGFFLPFMLTGVAAHAVALLEEGWNPETFATLYLTTFTLIFAVDVVFGSIGYLLTVRALDAQIRSAQPTWLGWVATIICYAPFSAFLYSTFLDYKGDIDWSAWLAGQPLVFITWGFVILVLQVVYVWATISFGCRFSNLTNRGIVVDGPYRYLKHPAYLCKNIAWWLISVPFVAHEDFMTNLKACFLLLLTNVIYFIRAKTEESHLAADPAYRLYAEWIQRNGLGAALRNVWINLRKRSPSAG